MEASHGGSHKEEEARSLRAIQIPFVSLYKPRSSSAFPVRELDPKWTVERTGFGHTSTFAAILPETMPNLGNHAYSMGCSRTLISWIDVLVLHASKSTEYAASINKFFEIPPNLNEIVLGNALVASKTADMVSAGVLLHNMWELFDPITFEPLALVTFPKLGDIELTGSFAEANTTWELIQSSSDTTKCEFYMLVYPSETLGEKKFIFVPGFKAPKFTSSFRMGRPGSLGLVPATLLKSISTLLTRSTNLLAIDGPQSQDLQITIYKILDQIMHLAQVCLSEIPEDAEAGPRMMNFSRFTMMRGGAAMSLLKGVEFDYHNQNVDKILDIFQNLMHGRRNDGDDGDLVRKKNDFVSFLQRRILVILSWCHL